MRSLKARFKKIEKNNPYWSSLVCFCEAVRGQRFTRRAIYSNFISLVDRSDYIPSQREALLDFSATL